MDIRLTNLGVNANQDADIEIPLTPAQLSQLGTELLITLPPNSLYDGVYRLELLPTVVDLNGTFDALTDLVYVPEFPPEAVGEDWAQPAWVPAPGSEEWNQNEMISPSALSPLTWNASQLVT